VEAVLLDPEVPTLSPGAQSGLWLLSRRGEITVEELAATSGTSDELAVSRLDDLVTAGLANRVDEGRYELAMSR